MTVQETSQEIPNWVLASLLSLMFGLFIGLFVWIVNRILTQQDKSQNQNLENFKRLTDAIVAIEKTTIVQNEILKSHSDDIKIHDEILKQLASATRTRK